MTDDEHEREHSMAREVDVAMAMNRGRRWRSAAAYLFAEMGDEIDRLRERVAQLEDGNDG